MVLLLYWHEIFFMVSSLKSRESASTIFHIIWDFLHHLRTGIFGILLMFLYWVESIKTFVYMKSFGVLKTIIDKLLPHSLKNTHWITEGGYSVIKILFSRLKAFKSRFDYALFICKGKNCKVFPFYIICALFIRRGRFYLDPVNKLA